MTTDRHDDRTQSVCTVCGGFAFRHVIVKGHPHGPWLHLHEDDWKDDPHDVVPQEVL